MNRRLVKRYQRHLWGGFLNGRLDLRFGHSGDAGRAPDRPSRPPGVPAVYVSRREAEKHYADVRRISIKELAR
jgi:hypothetical protein